MMRPVWREFCTALVSVIALASLASAQAPPQRPPATPAPAAPRDPALDDADRALQAMDWLRAADTYQQVVRRDPQNAQAWFHLGVALAATQNLKSAAEAFDRAEALGLQDAAKMAWDAAMVNAKLRRPDKTVDYLSTVVDGGLRAQILTSTPEFEFLRQDPTFQALVARAADSDRGGCSSTAYRGLDFWVGDWVIYDQDRVRVGTNHVAKTPDGCMLVETWTGTLGDSGRSLNYYNARTSRWTQVWIGDTGGVVEQGGVVVQGELRLEGETTQPDGTRVLNRLTLGPVGNSRLRQRAEVSRDGGRTWLQQFDFTYVRLTK